MGRPDPIVERRMRARRRTRASEDRRYVAVCNGGESVSRVLEGASGVRSSESDRYEDLLVNPTPTKLEPQGGSIDCGGLEFWLVRYGDFFQSVCPAKDGHESAALEASADRAIIPDVLLAIVSDLEEE